jgi:hypothetical protein
VVDGLFPGEIRIAAESPMERNTIASGSRATDRRAQAGAHAPGRRSSRHYVSPSNRERGLE